MQQHEYKWISIVWKRTYEDKSVDGASAAYHGVHDYMLGIFDDNNVAKEFGEKIVCGHNEEINIIEYPANMEL